MSEDRTFKVGGSGGGPTFTAWEEERTSMVNYFSSSVFSVLQQFFKYIMFTRKCHKL
jgi:hypothetical protein